jgi:hypothetical protein
LRSQALLHAVFSAMALLQSQSLKAFRTV